MSVDLDQIRSHLHRTHVYQYTEKDVIIYALSIGCRELRFVYERDPHFCALPSFAVVPAFGVLDLVPFGAYLPNFEQRNLLHGEHYVELLAKVPAAGRMHTTMRVIDIANKGDAAVVVVGASTVDAISNRKIAYQEFTCFILRTGKFQVVTPGSASSRSAAATAKHPAPDRKPDASVTEATSDMQAVLYRLSGDANPLHVDPAVAAAVGFPRPILHGLCTLGFSVKHVLHAFAGGIQEAVRSIKVRFVKHVFPGDTLRTDMWLQGGSTVVFCTTVVERGDTVIANAAVVLRDGCLVLPAKL